jgi:hypothetical protein
VVYRSRPDYVGPDGYSFRATDGTETTVVPITIDVTPFDAGLPPACPQSTVFVAPGATVHLKSPCFDPEGADVNVTGFTPPHHGTLVPTGPNEGDYTANNDGSTSDSFDFTVSDGVLTTTSTVDIHIGAAAGPFETAPEATPSEPLVAGLALPTGVTGSVVLTAQPVATPPPTGFSSLGTAFNITAPVGTAANPLTFTFKIDGSQAPDGQVVVFRDGVAITANCTGAGASPDPCLVPQPPVAPGQDVTIVVRSSHASLWQLFERDGYPFTGFFGPSARDVAQAGQAIPLQFALGGNQGLGVLTRVSSRPCGGGADVTADNVGNGLKYDRSTQRYQYNWKTSKSWGGTCRTLTLEFDDGSTHEAQFRFR